MSFINFTGQVLVVSQKLSEVDTSVLIKEHTSNSWSEIISENLLNRSVDIVTNKLRGLLTWSKRIQWSDINVWQLDKLLLVELNLLLYSWLLLLHVHLLLLRIDLSLILHLWMRHLTSLLLHSLSSMLIRVMLLIHVLIIVVITSTLLVLTTSSLAISSTSSSVLVCFVPVLVIPVLLLSALILVWNSSHLIHQIAISVILSKQ